MSRGRIEFDGAVMSTLETFDTEVVDEYNMDQLEILEEENDDAENLARELFSDDGVDVFDDMGDDDEDENFSGQSINVEIGEGSQTMDYEWGNYGDDRDVVLSEGLPLFYDYGCFENQPDWLADPDEYEGFDMSHAKGELYKGQRFVSKEAAIHAVKVYSIRNRVEYKVHKSEPCMVNLKCRLDGEDGINCNWHFRAVKKKNSVMFLCSVYSGPHTCEVDIIPDDNVHLNKDFIGWEIKDLIQERVRISPLLVKNMMQKKYGFEVSYLKAWRGRQKALKLLFGDWEKSFDLLPSYMDTICKRNPGTVVYWQKTEVDGIKFVDRLFWSFGPAIEAFKHCRPVLSVDGTHLYGKYQGKLLIAVGLDANNHVLPLAFALVESENNDSWGWFMNCLRAGVTDRSGLCVVSDRHAGIMHAMTFPEWSPPMAYHRFCIRHFASNFQTRVRRLELKRQLATIAYKNQKHKFDSSFRDFMELLQHDLPTRKWLFDTPPDKWTLAYDEFGMRWGSMTTNASEVYNGVIRCARDLPITALVHYTFKQSNHYFVRRREQYAEHGKKFAPKIEDKMVKLLKKAAFHNVTMYSHASGEASVRTRGSDHDHEINLVNRTCSCGKWQLFHYPCSHVIRVCRMLRLSKYYGVAPEYLMDYYNNTWAPVFHPMPDKAYWEIGPYQTHLPNAWFRRPAQVTRAAEPAFVRNEAVPRHSTRTKRGRIRYTPSQEEQGRRRFDH